MSVIFSVISRSILSTEKDQKSFVARQISERRVIDSGVIRPQSDQCTWLCGQQQGTAVCCLLTAEQFFSRALHKGHCGPVGETCVCKAQTRGWQTDTRNPLKTTWLQIFLYLHSVIQRVGYWGEYVETLMYDVCIPVFLFPMCPSQLGSSPPHRLWGFSHMYPLQKHAHYFQLIGHKTLVTTIWHPKQHCHERIDATDN